MPEQPIAGQEPVTPEPTPVPEPVTEPGVQGELVDPNVAAIKKVRNEAASWRVKFQNLTKKVEEIENKSKLDKMEESERLTTIAQQAQAETATYKEQAKSAHIKTAAFATASAMGFINPQLAVGGINLSSVAVDDDGNTDTEAIKLQLGALADSDPYLLRGNEQPKTPIQRGQFGASSPANPGSYPTVDRQVVQTPHNRVVTDTDAVAKGQIGTHEFFNRTAQAFERNKLLDPSARGADLDKGG